VRADLQVSVAEDRALRKRILSGFQGYFALKQKNAKQLHAQKSFLKFSRGLADRKCSMKTMITTRFT
jgi:hypothetical protein